MKGQPRLLGASVLMTVLLFSQSAYSFRYQPYDGQQGYQEIEVRRDTFFLSVNGHGSRARIDEVIAAWRTRAAELCRKAGHRHFVRLRYSFEPVLVTDKPFGADERRVLSGALIPAQVIFIPMGPGAGRMPTREWPTETGHLRCIEDPAGLIRPRDVFDVQNQISEARKRGWMLAD